MVSVFVSGPHIFRRSYYTRFLIANHGPLHVYLLVFNQVTEPSAEDHRNK